jgi:hypothetical protein
VTGEQILRTVDRVRKGEFPHYDWDAVADRVERQTDDPHEHFRLYSQAAKAWMTDVASVLGRPYIVRESEAFILVSSDTLEMIEQHLAALERMLDSIYEGLDGAAYQFYGKMPVVLFHEHQRFYEYLSDHPGPDGELRMVHAVNMGGWYPQIIAFAPEINELRAALCHETCHAVLAPYELPAWIDEALTQEVEHHVIGKTPYELNPEWIKRHRAYWTPERIEGFWAGDSFWYPDDGSELSYHLARFLLRGLTQDATLEERTAFLHAASREDGGRQAAEDVLGISLDEALDHFLKN